MDIHFKESCEKQHLSNREDILALFNRQRACRHPADAWHSLESLKAKQCTICCYVEEIAAIKRTSPRPPNHQHAQPEKQAPLYQQA